MLQPAGWLVLAFGRFFCFFLHLFRVLNWFLYVSFEASFMYVRFLLSLQRHSELRNSG